MFALFSAGFFCRHLCFLPTTARKNMTEHALSQSESAEPILYRLGRKSALWAEFKPSAFGLRRTWQMAVGARNRGGTKLVAPLLETGGMRPLATVTLKGEAYPLTIDRHEMKRGGILCVGGERKIGADGGVLDWEMRWLPLEGEEGAFHVEMRVRTTPRRMGALSIDLASPLHQPELWAIPPIAERGHSARSAWSAYSGYSIGLTTTDGEIGWHERGGWTLDLPAFSLGGGRRITFSLCFGQAATAGEARASLVTQYAAFAGPLLHSLDTVMPLNPSETIALLTAPEGYNVQGMERLYLKPPVAGEEGSYYGGFPHEPAGALKAFWDWNRLHETPDIPRLVRFGARGLCADFQVMGRGDDPEPNKGAFWDKMTLGVGTDYTGGATHGILSNAKLARSLFLLHQATGEPLLKQSGINIGHWLMLKQNEHGFYDGAHVRATRGLPDDGRVLPQPCALDGAEAIRAFVLAYQATKNEVWIKYSWKVADFLLSVRGRDFDSHSPPEVSGVILALLALDAESPNASLRAALREWGAWLQALPLNPESPALNSDGLHAGLYECAEASFGLFSLTRDLVYLRYAFAALAAVPQESRAASWRSAATHQAALLSLAGLLPNSKLDFDAPSVTLDWRVFAPDPAAAPFLSLEPTGGPDAWIDWLPLVCRATDQLLLLCLAPPTVDAVTVWKNGKRPFLHDLRTGALDTEALLAPLGKERWAHVGLFRVDP